MVLENRLKERLKAGRPALGCWLHLASPIAAEIVAHAGYDALVIDHEHGPGDFVNAILSMQAASGTQATTMIRVPWNDMVTIKRALDSGAQGVMVPYVQSAEEARAAVAACRYPPEGVRGYANQVTRCAGYGANAKAYDEGWPENLLLICQIETRKAVDNIPEIAAVDGIDMLFIGPSDLAASIGHLGEVDHAEVGALIAEAESRIAEAGKMLGTVPRPGRSAKDLIEAGYHMVIGSSDATLLRRGAEADVRACAAPTSS